MFGLLWSLPLSLAAVPDGVPVVLAPDASGGTFNLAVSDDGLVVVAAEGDDRLVLVDARSWTSSILDMGDVDAEFLGCSVKAAAVVASGNDHDVFVGCSNGEVLTLSWDGETLSGTDVPVFDAGDGSILELFATTDRLWTVLDTNPSPTFQAWSLANSQWGDAGTNPNAILPQDHRESVLLRGPDGTPSVVVTHHNAERFTNWTLANGQVQLSTNAPGIIGTAADIAVRQGGGAWTVSGNGTIGAYDGTAGQVSTQALYRNEGDLEAVMAWTQEDGPASLLVFSDGGLDVWPATGGAAAPEDAFSIDVTLRDMVEGVDGYGYGATAGSGIAVLTANPWVEGLTLEPSNVVAGTEVTVSFDVDTDGAWTLARGGDRLGGGTTIAQGDATAGNVSTTFTVGDDLSEGRKTLWLRHAEPVTGLVGYARAFLEVDNVPAGIQLLQEDVGFGNRKIVVQFNGTADEDLVEYRLYVSKTPFTPAQYVGQGGPSGNVDGVTSPVTVEPGTGTAIVRREIKGLTNGTTYWVGIRAYDGNQEGPMSDVWSATPSKTNGACALSGEETCVNSCNTGGRLPWLGWGGLLMVAGLVRRRRVASGPFAAALVACVAVGLLAPAVATAQDAGDDRVPMVLQRDTTPAWATFGFEGGPFGFRGDAINTIYGNGGATIKLTAGVQIFRYGEITGGLGYTWKRGNTVGADGTSSLENIRLEWLPLDLTARVRIAVLDEQPVVPYAGVGIDWVFWRETPLDENGAGVPRRRVAGSKLGWHWEAGAAFLLDLLQPRRAGILEANTGINDTWLTVAYRDQYVNQGGEGLDLSGWSVLVGVKIDY